MTPASPAPARPRPQSLQYCQLHLLSWTLRPPDSFCNWPLVLLKPFLPLFTHPPQPAHLTADANFHYDGARFLSAPAPECLVCGLS